MVADVTPHDSASQVVRLKANVVQILNADQSPPQYHLYVPEKASSVCAC